MRDARDHEDKRLLDEDRIDDLLEAYYEIILGRCFSTMRGAVAYDVTQAVCERLWRELKAGRHRDGLPFRVIVHKVIDWTCKGWYEDGWGESELIEPDGAAEDFASAVEFQADLESHIETFPPEDRKVAVLRFLEGLEPAEIAERLNKEPNAVYQAISRNNKRLAAWAADT